MNQTTLSIEPTAMPRGITLTPFICDTHAALEASRMELIRAQERARSAQELFQAASASYSSSPSAVNWRALDGAARAHQSAFFLALRQRSAVTSLSTQLLAAVTTARIGSTA